MLGFGFRVLAGVGFMLGFGFQAWLQGLKPMGFGFRPPHVKPLQGAKWQRRLIAREPRRWPFEERRPGRQPFEERRPGRHSSSCAAGDNYMYPHRWRMLVFWFTSLLLTLGSGEF